LDDSDSDDESNSDESLDHGGEIGPPAAPVVDAVAPAPAPAPPETPPRSPSPAAPPRPPSPIGIDARLPRRTRNKPREWWKLSNAQLDNEVDDEIEDADMGYEIACSTVSMAEPLSYAEAMRHPDAEQWKQAALEELNAHSTNGTWKLIPRPPGNKVIGSKWVFKVKRNIDGSIERYKGRLVVKGYNQQPGFDYIEIFAPTVRMSTIDLGATTQLLGIKIDRDRSKHSITISEHQYCLDILEHFGMADCKPISTPMQPNQRLSRAQCPQTPAEVEYMKSIPYLAAVGALIYLATSTRPDIAYTVGCLARSNLNPGIAHWHAVKHLLRYLKGTADYSITYAPDSSRSELFRTYSDAVHGGCKDTGCSTGGYLVKIGIGAVS